MQIDELPGEDGQLDRPLVGVSPVNGKIFAFDVAQLPKLFSKTVELGEILFVTSQDADAPYALGLLRARRERPRRRRAAEQRDELAPLSFNHLVGGDKQARRHRQAECLRGLEVEDRFVPGRRLHR